MRRKLQPRHGQRFAFDRISGNFRRISCFGHPDSEQAVCNIGWNAVRCVSGGNVYHVFPVHGCLLRNCDFAVCPCGVDSGKNEIRGVAVGAVYGIVSGDISGVCSPDHRYLRADPDSSDIAGKRPC